MKNFGEREREKTTKPKLYIWLNILYTLTQIQTSMIEMNFHYKKRM